MSNFKERLRQSFSVGYEGHRTNVRERLRRESEARRAEQQPMLEVKLDQQQRRNTYAGLLKTADVEENFKSAREILPGRWQLSHVRDSIEYTEGSSDPEISPGGTWTRSINCDIYYLTRNLSSNLMMLWAGFVDERFTTGYINESKSKYGLFDKRAPSPDRILTDAVIDDARYSRGVPVRLVKQENGYSFNEETVEQVRTNFQESLSKHVQSIGAYIASKPPFWKM